MEKFSIRNKYKYLKSNNKNIDNTNEREKDYKNLNNIDNKNILYEKKFKENKEQNEFKYGKKKENSIKESHKTNILKSSYKKEIQKDLINNLTENHNIKEDKKFQQIFQLLKILKIYDTMNTIKSDKNAVEIIPHLYIGSFACASNLEELESKKITNILCCGLGLKLFFPEKFKYHKIDLVDKEKENIRKYFEETNKFINDAIINKGNVLIHCYAGISRSSSIIIAYLMKHNHMTFNNAFQLIKEKRGNVRPNSGFILQLKAYEKELGY